jgi:hypothetical protein
MQKVILYSLKSALHLSLGEIRESTTLSRCDFSLFKGIYNKVIFNIKSNDNIDITTFPNLFIYFIRNEEILFKGILSKEKHYYIFNDAFQEHMEYGFYEYVVTTDANTPIYADQNFNVRGYFQVKKGIPSEVKPTTGLVIPKQTILGKVIYKSTAIAIPYNPLGNYIIQSDVLKVDCIVRVYGTLESSPTVDSKLWDIVSNSTIGVDSKLDIKVDAKLQYLYFEIEPLVQPVTISLPDNVSITIY